MGRPGCAWLYGFVTGFGEGLDVQGLTYARAGGLLSYHAWPDRV